MNIGKGHSFGKVIVIGEHSVVYGHGALVLPFPAARVDVTITSTQGPLLIKSSHFSGLFFEEGAPISGIQGLAKQFFNDYKLSSDNLFIDVSSTIPTRRGLGSSAAIAKALTVALFDYFKLDLTTDILIKYISISELIYHVRPSGIDMNCVVYERPLWYQKGSFTYIEEVPSFKIVVADTGKPSQTKVSVSMVAKNYVSNINNTVENIEELGLLAKQFYGISNTNELTNLGFLFNKAQSTLRSLGVSDQIVEELCTVANTNGALGSKLTGGGQGGCMIAICDNEQNAKQVEKALLKAGASKTWIIQ